MTLLQFIILTACSCTAWALHTYILGTHYHKGAGFMLAFYLGLYLFAVAEGNLLSWINRKDNNRTGAVFMFASTLRMLALLTALLVFKVNESLDVFTALNTVAAYFFFLLLSVLFALPLLRNNN